MRLYLAGPMRDHTVAEAMQWRKVMANSLTVYGITAVLPGFLEGATTAPLDRILSVDDAMKSHNFVTFDLALVKSCDVLLANLSYATRKSTGTLSEISWANALGKPVIVVGNNEWTVEPFVKEQALAVVATLGEAELFLRGLAGGR